MDGHSEQAELTRIHWRLRFATLVAGAVVASFLIWLAWEHRMSGPMAALRLTQHTKFVSWHGHRIAAELHECRDVYPPTWWSGEFALWLGNSQMHTINQYQDDEQTAPYYASESLGWPTICVSLPNGNLQEFLVITAWALDQRPPTWLIIQVVYDDLRQDELRPGMEEFATKGTMERLRESTIGTFLADELESNAESSHPPNVTANAESFEDQSEAALENLLGNWDVWRSRGDMETATEFALTDVRNTVFQISPTSKRRMIRPRYDRNMAALTATLNMARDENVRVLLYIAPLRQNPEPPYFMDQYDKWKENIRELAESKGAVYADLDSIVADEEWGALGETKTGLDFMHFRVGGHIVVGHRIAELLKDSDTKDGR